MPRRREARALIGPFAGEVGRIEALGVRNVGIDDCDVIITFGVTERGGFANAHAFAPGEWERITPPLVRSPEQKARDVASNKRWEQRCRDAGWRKSSGKWIGPGE